jgi:uncharacterized protein YutE (UPF0331/DUF86 family)
MIDPDLVFRKMNLIGPDLEKIIALAAKDLEGYLADSTLEDLAERYLERVIGRMIDINFHLITESGLPPPRDYYDSFLKLGEMHVLPSDLAKRVAACAGLRNRIAHEYDVIDPIQVYGGLKAAATDIPEYPRHIESYLEPHRGSG